MASSNMLQKKVGISIATMTEATCWISHTTMYFCCLDVIYVLESFSCIYIGREIQLQFASPSNKLPQVIQVTSYPKLPHSFVGCKGMVINEWL